MPRTPLGEYVPGLGVRPNTGLPLSIMPSRGAEGLNQPPFLHTPIQTDSAIFAPRALPCQLAGTL